MLVVSDTTAIISLLKIGKIDILSMLFSEVVIARAVHEELLRYHPSIPAFLEVRSVKDAGLLSTFLGDLDAGEAESIALAVELGAQALLIDERRGRRIAERHGLRCLGLAGVTLMAKQRGLIPSVGDLLDDLERNARFYLSPDLKRELIRKAGESP